MSATPMETRWRCPPESSFGLRVRHSAGRPTFSAISATRRRRSGGVVLAVDAQRLL